MQAMIHESQDRVSSQGLEADLAGNEPGEATHHA
jgi:hypothetical protein